MVDVLLNIKNRGGSVEHYYHFLLGFLLPLAIKSEEYKYDPVRNSIIVRSCGPMDRHIQALNISKLAIIDAKEHASLCEVDFKNITSRYDKHMISGFDDVFGNYEIDMIKNGAQIIKQILCDDLNEMLSNRASSSAQENRQIVLIKRDKDNFYTSGKAEISTSGSERRSIENFNQLQACIEEQKGNLTTVILEKATLAEQISIFSKADIIIAQHGAALANLVWSPQTTKVIEIAHELPPQFTNCFSSLSRCLGLKYRRVAQKGRHGECDIAAVKKLLVDESVIW